MEHRILAQPKGKKSIKVPLTAKELAAKREADIKEEKSKKNKKGILDFLTGDK